MFGLFSTAGQDQPSAQLMNDDPEPWGFRGGLSGEFQVISSSVLLIGHGVLFRVSFLM